ncbi:MAG: hypothetical protein OXF43_12050 [Gammaproteobacteria bacterium]|nr:hypothetical protein [Gammaproteobacteria bacterium]
MFKWTPKALLPAAPGGNAGAGKGLILLFVPVVHVVHVAHGVYEPIWPEGYTAPGANRARAASILTKFIMICNFLEKFFNSWNNTPIPP